MPDPYQVSGNGDDRGRRLPPVMAAGGYPQANYRPRVDVVNRVLDWLATVGKDADARQLQGARRWGRYAMREQDRAVGCDAPAP